jgi:hypothetical protein
MTDCQRGPHIGRIIGARFRPSPFGGLAWDEPHALESLATVAHLTVAEGFDERLQAGCRPDEFAAICALTR